MHSIEYVSMMRIFALQLCFGRIRLVFFGSFDLFFGLFKLLYQYRISLVEASGSCNLFFEILLRPSYFLILG